jgi:hypothetical protein
MTAGRARILKLPGSCAQNAASSATSSRAITMPVSAAAERAMESRSSRRRLSSSITAIDK